MIFKFLKRSKRKPYYRKLNRYAYKEVLKRNGKKHYVILVKYPYSAWQEYDELNLSGGDYFWRRVIISSEEEAQRKVEELRERDVAFKREKYMEEEVKERIVEDTKR